ncbi:hypothetical protein M3666_14110 [Curtobacterium sp. ODYSSEY 48 V2]|uniref:hypothetical protein n=1 Tax=unclassified Curtobacterium TaxID=257496 RepID=UPI00203A5C9E|nr:MULTISPECIES: hypothetical protein [unclassified Curtobacterium]MCM3506249.1 hypothetical protein [Curtobacterium sp. ODYSSEY 48 V2]MDB6425746.1 hypothetical protein [Curtobacterium sp. 20TX0008]
MSRRLPVTAASVVLAVTAAVVLAGCSGGDGPERTASASPSRSATPAPTGSAPTTVPPSSGSSPSDVPSPGPSGGVDDGTGPGTGNGSGVEQPDSVDFAAVSAQGVAAAGGGTVVSLAGSGDEWTVVVAGPDGSRTQSVVSATLGRVTSGPFPRDVDAATAAADAARSAAAEVDAAAAAASATAAVPGSTLRSVVLEGSDTAPVWNAVVTVGGAERSVTVDARTGTAAA